MSYVDVEAQEVFQCPWCGGTGVSSSSDLPQVIPVSEFSVRYQFPDGISPRLITCDNCSLVYKNFYLDESTESTLYNLWLKNGSNRWRDSKNEVDIQRQLSIDIIDQFKNIAGRTPDSVIDIGAGEGGYLDYLPEYERFSLDVNPVSVEQNSQRGIQSIQLDVCSDSWVPTQSFDLVTCFDVLEHLREPDIGIRNISKLLAPGGVFIAETGNIECFISKYYGAQNWWYVNIPEHKIFWRKENLHSAFSKYGIDLVKIELVTHKNKPVITLRNMKNLILLMLGLWPNKKKFRKIFLNDHFYIVGVKRV